MGRNYGGHAGQGEQRRRVHPAQRPYHHPYYFVPMPPRDVTHPELGDHEPVGHHRLHEDLWTGTIDLQVIVNTPLLLPDLAEATDDEHKTYGMRLGPDGRPYLPPTSLKGMLRAAYEAATNSRLGVFGAHDTRLARREPASEGVEKIPFRVNEQGVLQLLRGLDSGDKRGKTMRAAWLPFYGRDAVRLQGRVPKHKQYVWAYVVEQERQGEYPFRLLRVAALEPGAADMPPYDPDRPRIGGRYQYPGQPVAGWVRGWVCVSGRNIERKHDERVFFDDSPEDVTLNPDLEDLWARCIESYHEANRRDVERGAQRPAAALDDRTVYSRHITVAPPKLNDDERHLVPGTMGYAAVDEDGNITGLYPVQISRRLEHLGPRKLVSEAHLPASDRAQLSPADRVFGWVHPMGHGAHRGQLRVGATVCGTPADQAIRSFANALPLAILGQPKPQQARFYVAADQNGRALDDCAPRARVGFQDESQGLRGRKIYPHHKPEIGHEESYWKPTDREGPQSVGQRYREYLHPGKSNPQRNEGLARRNDQNRSLRAWVQPRTWFSCRLHVTNLSSVELGALLWLLSWRPSHYHRLGGGKPLGFGSVRLIACGLDLHQGTVCRQRYRSLNATTSVHDSRSICWTRGRGETLSHNHAPIQAYMSALEEVEDMDFADIPAIKSLLVAARGFDTPIHYPRGTEEPNPKGEGYEWFVENESTRRGATSGFALPGLDEDATGLPYLQKPVKTDDPAGGGPITGRQRRVQGGGNRRR